MVPNAVDLPERVARPAAVPPTGVVLGNLLPYKGHTVLLDALAQLPAPPRILFVGTGPMRTEITRRAEALNLAKSIEIVEGVSDPWPVLLDSELSVLPSLTEGMPNAILESMAAGLPVIASRVGAVPDLISDGDEGLLVNPGDVSGLARALQYALDRPEWRADAGARGRQRAGSFTWRAMAQRNLDIMERDLVRARNKL
jgi:glycosyltransferase involved in cell wall biosynthesis